MVFAALNLLKEELGAFLETRNGSRREVVLGNIALFESNDIDAINEKIVITLVNIEEESVLKNINAFHRVNSEGRTEYAQPTLNLNLYLLFTANYKERETGYENALKRLSNVIQFLQGRNIFTLSNSPNANLNEVTSNVTHNPDITEADLSEMKLILDLYTMTFEQINHLWGSLGGKQMPFVMYKARLIKVKDRRTRLSEPVIEEVDAQDAIL